MTDWQGRVGQSVEAVRSLRHTLVSVRCWAREHGHENVLDIITRGLGGRA